MGTVELSGRAALLTGGVPAVGTAIAQELRAAGAALASAAQGMARDDASIFIDPPAVEEATIRTAVAESVARLGRLDILIHVLAAPAGGPARDLPAWRSGIGATLDAAFLWSKAALPHLRRSDAAAIVHVAGMAAAADALVLAAAQAGIAGLTRALAHELGESGITVNCMAPLPGQDGAPALVAHLASMVRHLCGPAGRYVTGQVIHLGGV